MFTQILFNIKIKIHSLEYFQNAVKGLSLAFSLLVLKERTEFYIFLCT